MEFTGFEGKDFDFFKKKDRLSREDYERGRNHVKLHFRELCYEIQKLYHKETNGFFQIERDFQNFNKRSLFISARHLTDIKEIYINLQMDYEGFTVELIRQSLSQKDSDKIIDILKTNKKIIWEYIMGSKSMYVYVDFEGRDKDDSIIKLSALDMNTKNYDKLIKFISENNSNGKNTYKFGIGYLFSKGESTKQGKDFTNSVYTALSNLLDLSKKLI